MPIHSRGTLIDGVTSKQSTAVKQSSCGGNGRCTYNRKEEEQGGNDLTAHLVGP
ncbi:hypothetical protein RMSM_06084 [Rhodopirellula maiorica SM1]|uniref:Uncharacterized protein n=1 Tax=Rhodopirellula maiorica SM1 TaxID=1265738 RepID=M5RBX8_9BACT|nr:hypothetical protein RMSM_06084 [Rhodopirellula maiorica SM1]